MSRRHRPATSTYYRVQNRRLSRRLVVDELNHVVRIRRGRVDCTLTPGVHRIRPRIDQIRTLPAGEQVLVVPGQEVLTSDGATIRVTLSVLTEVQDAAVLVKQGEYQPSLYLRVQLALRTAISERSLEQLLAERNGFDDELLAAVRPYASEIGLEVRQIVVRDLVVPGELKRAVTEVLTARLAGQAMLERARAETAALRSLANAARIAEQTPALIPLRLMQQMETTTGNTYVVNTELPAS